MADLLVLDTDAVRRYDSEGKIIPGDSSVKVKIEGTPKPDGTFDLRNPDGFSGEPVAYIVSESQGKFDDKGKWLTGDQGKGDGKFLYEGHYEKGGHYFFVFKNGAGQAIIHSETADLGRAGVDGKDDFEPNLNTVSCLLEGVKEDQCCFMAGTEIATPAGICLVEDLKIGDPILTASGKVIAVKWVGRRSYYPRFQRNERIEPVRIRAGALGSKYEYDGTGLPYSDLTVTADHGMILDGMVIHASALVNGSTIAFVPLDDLPDRVTYYHIETEAHEVILANGAAAETFVDVVTRAAFDNYAEYLNLYGVERMIPEMDRLRVTAHRLLTAQARQQLGIAAPAPATATETPEPAE